MPIIFPRYPKVVLTGDADPGNVMLGKTFYKDDYKQKLTGTYVPAAPPVLDGDAGPGDVLAGKTFYKDDAYTKLTGTIPSKAAATITPGTTNQVIAAGQYLSGAQTIKGDANLVAGNIKEGVNIFGIVGTLTTVSPGDTIVAENNPETPPLNNPDWTKVKETIVPLGGGYKVTFQAKRYFSVDVGDYDYYAYARIYVDGVAVGVEKTIISDTYQEFSENITANVGSKIQVYFKKLGDQWSPYGLVANMKIGISFPSTNTLV